MGRQSVDKVIVGDDTLELATGDTEEAIRAFATQTAESTAFKPSVIPDCLIIDGAELRPWTAPQLASPG